MNRNVSLYTVGQIVKLEGLLLVLPLIVSLCYAEYSLVRAFLLTIAVAIGLGFLLTIVFRKSRTPMYAKGGFITVALSWVVLSLVGALPFVISGQIPSYIDAVFETVSGFSTTGSSILPDPAVLGRGLLFWRSFTHWVGGMGIIVFMLAVTRPESGRAIHILRAEVPGPIVGKLVPRLRDTAKILYLIYFALTVAQVIFLLCGGMPLFDSLVHTFGTAGTGGFGIRSSSIGGYSPYLQWVITIFMLLFGLNFNLFYLLLLRRIKSVFKSGETWTYLGVVVVAITLITVNLLSQHPQLSEALRLAAFQVSSIITTTGYATADFAAWPELSKTILFLLMFIGGCAGSTAGGLKVSRILLLFKSIRRDYERMVHPHAVGVVHMDGKRVDDRTLGGVTVYFALYMMILAFVLLLLSFNGFDLVTNLSAAVACFNNVGPGFGEVGPTSSFAGYSDFSKIVLSFAMLFGRLEIYPLLIALTPAAWTKK
ncbi:MAG: TrkH family potassium uptake protein [Clostridia bacterium]|nr:TrkH family potassium uptake protein [Clostridia bacterium]